MLKNEENKPLIANLMRASEEYRKLKLDERFKRWKADVVDGRKEELINAALMMDLSTRAGQMSAISLLIAAKEVARLDDVFREMEHYGEEAERLLSDQSKGE